MAPELKYSDLCALPIPYCHRGVTLSLQESIDSYSDSDPNFSVEKSLLSHLYEAVLR